MSRRRSGRATVGGRVAAVLIGLVLLVFAAEAVLRIGYPQWREFHSGRFVGYVMVSGYGPLKTGKPGFDGYFAQNNGDFRVRVRINEFGLRNPDPVAAADGQVWVVGDSMTFGWGVERDEAYPEVLQRRLDHPTYNLAAPGNDVCGYQMMVARMPKGIRPKAVIVGLILENDVTAYDCKARFRRMAATTELPTANVSLGSLVGIKDGLTRYSALYNVLAVSLKRLPVAKEALITLGVVAKEHAYRNTLAENDIGRLTAATADELVNLRALLPGTVPFAVLIVPTRFEIKLNDPVYRTLRLEMVAALTARGLDVIDPVAGFAEAGFAATHFTHDGHWSVLGHEIAGKAAAGWLKTRLPFNGSRPEEPTG